MLPPLTARFTPPEQSKINGILASAILSAESTTTIDPTTPPSIAPRADGALLPESHCEYKKQQEVVDVSSFNLPTEDDYRSYSVAIERRIIEMLQEENPFLLPKKGDKME